MTDNEWFDNNYLMSPYGENGFLFTVQYLLLKTKQETLNLETLSEVDNIAFRAVTSQRMSKYTFKDSKSSKEPWSDDNHIALMVLNKLMNRILKPHNIHYFWDFDDRYFYEYWWRRWQPKHFIFFLYASKCTRIFSYPFLWIMSLWFMGTCLNSGINKQAGVVDTDGKILIFMILSVYNFPITKKLCNWAIRKNKRVDSWKHLFEIYFRDKNHPNRNFKEFAYEI